MKEPETELESGDHRTGSPVDTPSEVETRPQHQATAGKGEPLVTPHEGHGTASAESTELPGLPLLPTAPSTPGAERLVVVPGYEILGELGRGGMGVVYKARQRGLNRLVALKMILAGGHAGAQDLARLQTEGEAIARLQHPNIVQIYEVGQYGGIPFLSLEYLEGGSLKARLGGAPLPPRQAAELVQTLARAVHAAHQRGIIHRDLKPGNVLLAGGKDTPLAQCTPKITDFGLAKRLDGASARTESGAVLGTAGYMAPEQAEGKSKDAGPATDVYALGALLYELLTGRPPFRGLTSWDTLRQVQEEEPIPPHRLQAPVPHDLETICLKCLEKQAARRYRGAADLADDLRRFLAHEPIMARPASRAYRLGKFTRRNRGVVAGLTAVFLALVAGVIGTSLGLVRESRERARARSAELDARTAEQQTHRLLAASYYDAARLAMRRGAWREALTNIDRALAAGYADSVALQLDRVRAWCAVHEVPRAMREVQELARRTDLGDLEGQVLLWQADLALNQSDKDVAAVLAQVKRALERGLPPAEAAHARGLLARTTPEAVEHFRRALQEDPFNPRTSALLALLLTLRGQREEARQRLLVAELLFPEDPSFGVIQALLFALEDNMPAANAQLARAEPQLRDKQRAAARAIVELCNQVPLLGRVMERLVAADTQVSAWRILWQTMPAVLRARAALADPEGDLFLPSSPVFRQASQEFPPLTGVRGDMEGMAERLRRIAEVHPDSLLFVARGYLLECKGTPQAWAEAEEAFLQGAEAPSIVPLRRAALFGATACQFALARDGPPEKRAERRRQAAQGLHMVVALGVRPELAYQCSVMAISLEEWEVAHWVLSEWERQTPRDPRLPGQRVMLAFHSGAYGRALELVNQIVKENPKQAGRWEALRKQAAARLRKQLEAVPPPGKAAPVGEL